MHSSSMTGLDEQLHICVHERDSHCHCRAVWQDKIRVVAELLNHTENIIPPTTIQPRAMIAQLIDNLESISLWRFP